MIKKFINSGRKLGLASLVAGSIVAGSFSFPLTANSQTKVKQKIGNILYIEPKTQNQLKPRTIEEYYKNQIADYTAKGDITRALATEYREEQVEKAKRTFKRNGGTFHPFELPNSLLYSWDETEHIMAVGDILLRWVDNYQTANIPEGFQETGKLYLFNLTHSPIGSQIFFGSHPTRTEMEIYNGFASLVWLLACDQVPKHVTSHFLPKKYNKYVRKTMLSLSLTNSACNVYNNEKITGGIIFKKAF